MLRIRSGLTLYTKRPTLEQSSLCVRACTSQGSRAETKSKCSVGSEHAKEQAMSTNDKPTPSPADAPPLSKVLAEAGLEAFSRTRACWTGSGGSYSRVRMSFGERYIPRHDQPLAGALKRYHRWPSYHRLGLPRCPAASCVLPSKVRRPMAMCDRSAAAFRHSVPARDLRT